MVNELSQYDMGILYIKATVVSVCVGSAWKILPVIIFPDVIDSRKKRNQGQSDFLKSSPRCNFPRCN